jgi:hypothetical protein
VADRSSTTTGLVRSTGRSPHGAMVPAGPHARSPVGIRAAAPKVGHGRTVQRHPVGQGNPYANVVGRLALQPGWRRNRVARVRDLRQCPRVAVRKRRSRQRRVSPGGSVPAGPDPGFAVRPVPARTRTGDEASTVVHDPYRTPCRAWSAVWRHGPCRRGGSLGSRGLAAGVSVDVEHGKPSRTAALSRGRCETATAEQ